MAAVSHVFGLALQSMLNKEIDYDTDTIKALLCQSSYPANQDTHRYLTSIRRTVTDGVTTNASPTVTSATAAFTSADVGARITGTGIPASSYIGIINSGTSVGLSSSQTSNVPVNATATGSALSLTFSHEVSGTGYTAGGVTLASKTVTYDAPSHTLTLDCADLSWPSSTITARFVVFYESTGTDSTSALISYVDFGADQQSVAGTFPYVVPTTGIAQFVSV